MNKKKIVSLCLVLALVLTAVVGGTMAYFSDTDAQTNTFTTGNVAIDLYEDFNGDATDPNYKPIAKLFPTTGKDANGNVINAIEKEVYVENEGSEAAYVRVHIAIPNALDSGAKDIPALMAYNNILHFNFAKDSYAEGKWNWNVSKDGDNYPGNGGDWNTYCTTIGNIEYNVYVVTYETALAGAVKNADGTYTYDTTVDAIYQVYLDSTVTNEAIAELNKILGEEWNIIVAAEGTQAEGFADAYTALNTAFGDPADEEYTSKINWAAVAGDTWVEKTSVKGK